MNTHPYPYPLVDNEREPPPKKFKQRSRTGCRTCRSRKVKCDEYPGGCKNCARLDLVCPNSSAHRNLSPRDRTNSADSQTSTPAIRTQAGLKRSRTYRSCGACRGSKSRCSGGRPLCERCLQRGLECVYDGKQVPDWVEATSSLVVQNQNSQGSSSQGYSPSSSPRQLCMTVEGNTSDCDESETSASMSQDACAEVDFTWLFSATLPDQETQLVSLIHEYFLNVHSLRCLGFIHRPSLMQQLEDRVRYGLGDDMLMHIICALGAKFLVLKHASDDVLETGFALLAGNQWAKRAQSLFFASMSQVSMEKAMAAVLIQEHEMRLGNNASAFMFSGLAVRMCQTLGINTELSPDVPCETPRLSLSLCESRRRLAWAVWSIDASFSTKNDGHSIIEDNTIQLQLPCDERSFCLQITSFLEIWCPGMQLPETTPSEEPCLQAQFLRLMSLRKKMFKHIRRQSSSQTVTIPYREFIILDKALNEWHLGLPQSLHFTQSAVSEHKVSFKLAGLVSLHVLYHQTHGELHKLYAFSDFAGSPAPASRNSDLVHQSQLSCFKHASTIPRILEEAARHGPATLSDLGLATAAHESSVMLACCLQSGAASLLELELSVVVASMRSNLKGLASMMLVYSPARRLHDEVEEMIAQADPAFGKRASPVVLLTAPPRDSSLSDYHQQQFVELPACPSALLSSAMLSMEDESRHQTSQGVSLPTGIHDSFHSADQEPSGLMPGEGIFQGLLPMGSTSEQETWS